MFIKGYSNQLVHKESLRGRYGRFDSEILSAFLKQRSIILNDVGSIISFNVKKSLLIP